MSAARERLERALESHGCRRSGKDRTCPAHDDRKASLSVSEGDDGKVLVKCHAGCQTEDVVQALDMTMSDLFETNGDGRQRGGSPVTAPGDPVATYDYTDESGRLLSQVCRYEPKSFLQRRPKEGGGWTWNLNGTRRVLFRLQRVLAASQGEVVYVVEGEKDTLAIEKVGVVATCNPGGAGKWREEYSLYLKGAHVRVVADQDEAGRRHAAQVRDSLKGIAESVVVLQPNTGKDVSDHLNAGHGLDDLIEARAHRPSMDAGDRDLPRVTQDVWAALETANDPPVRYRHGSVPVRLVSDDHGRPALESLTFARMRHAAARCIDWYKLDRNGMRRSACPSREVIEDVLATPAQEMPLPVLMRVVMVPTFSAAGTLHTKPGYNETSRNYLWGDRFAALDVPLRPDAGEIEAARKLITDEMFGEFPFVGESERAHAVALLLLPLVRDMIDGPTPLHLIEKPSPGTGAGLMVDVIMRIAVGEQIAVMTEGRDEDEWRKRITAKLLTAPSVILIDNLSHRRRLESAALSAAITANVWEDRMLGKSEIVPRLPVRCAWVATGNNPAISDEITRRIVRIRMDAGVERPWLRSDFRHPDLGGWVDEHTPALVRACIVLVGAWIAAGRPVGSAKLGMFERWSEVMGGILGVASIDGFLGNVDAFYRESDQEAANWGAFLDAWWDRYGGDEVTVAELFRFLGLTDVVLDLGTGSDHSRKVKLGRRIGECRDRPFNGRVIRRAGERKRAIVWRLEEGECG